MSFKEDLQNFVGAIQSGNDEVEIKKEYISLVKKYHPDRVSEKEKDTYTEYMTFLNKVYSQGKTKVREVQIENEPNVVAEGKQSSDGKEYVYTKYKNGKTYSYPCRSYFDYLYKVARGEYDAGHEILHFGKDVNYLDKASIDKNSLEVMQHYWNAIKCYKFIIQHCKDEVLVSSAKFDYQMATDANNTLARTLALAGNELIVKEN